MDCSVTVRISIVLQLQCVHYVSTAVIGFVIDICRLCSLMSNLVVVFHIKVLVVIVVVCYFTSPWLLSQVLAQCITGVVFTNNFKQLSPSVRPFCISNEKSLYIAIRGRADHFITDNESKT